MKHFLKIASGLDVMPLLQQLEAHPELWDMNRRRKDAPGTPHSRMSDIWVRYNDVKPFEKAGDFSKFNDEHFPVWYPAYRALPALKPIIFHLMALTEGEHLGGVLITKIPPGEGIREHADRGWHVEFYDKFYLSIRSSPGAKFVCYDEALEPKPGECWRFDNRLPHSVKNESNEDRITLIVCIRTEKYKNVSAA
jgi:hypothetical protein